MRIHETTKPEKSMSCRKSRLISPIALVFALGANLLSPQLASAQTDSTGKAEKPLSGPQATAPARPWVVNCSTSQGNGELVCQMSQQLVSPETKRPVLSIVFRSTGKGKPLNMLLAMPHGLFLPAGLSMQIDNGRPSQSVIQASDAKGVYAALPVTNEMLAKLKAGNLLKVTMNSVQRKKLTIPVSLNGFTAAVEKLQSLN